MATAAVSSSVGTNYPVSLEVADPAPQGRVSVYRRWLFATPHFIVVGLLALAMPFVWVVSSVAIVATGRYPAPLLRFSVGVARWTMRSSAYAYLLTGSYPPFSLDANDEYPVRLLIHAREEGRNRLTAFFLVRLILALPHLVITWFLLVAAVFVSIVAAVAAMIGGSVPLGMHNFLAGVLRWYARVYTYVYNLVDEYPPFSLS